MWRALKTALVDRVSFWRGVLRDYLLSRRWVPKFLGNMRKRQLLRSLSLQTPFQKDTLWTGTISLSYITEIVLKLVLGAVVLARDLNNFHTVIPGDLGLWEN